MLLAACGALVFRASWAQYERVSGNAVTIAFLRSVAFVVVLAATAALAWGAAVVCFEPGRWRDTAAALLFSVLFGAVGAPVLRLITRIIEVWNHL